MGVRFVVDLEAGKPTLRLEHILLRVLRALGHTGCGRFAWLQQGRLNMPRQLNVWLSGAHIGTLAQIDGRLGFSYAADWLAHTGAVPPSQSLPLQAAPL